MSNVYLNMVETVKNAEIVAKAFNIEPFPIYLLGGSACILGKYTERATQDIDFVDIDELMAASDKELIAEIIKEVLNRKDLFDSKRQAFLRNLEIFREKYHV